MRTSFTRLNSILGGAALAVVLAGAARPASAQTAYGLTVDLTGTYSLATFQLSAPGTFTSSVPVTGLAAGQEIVGFDTRPNTGQLFALGYNANAATNNSQLYVLATSGALTPVGGPQTLALGSDDTRIGFDFNPTVDRIRVTSANRANYRLNPVTGGVAATDGTLTYATTDPNAGQTPGVGSSAYTNSYIGSTSTTLYNLDEAASRLVTQNPPNNGTLNTVGPLGVSTSSNLQISDFDIYFNPATSQNVAYLTVSTVNLSTFTVSNQLYTLNLGTGATASVGTVGSGNTFTLVDFAVAISRPATLPAVTGQLVYALAGTNLLTFDSANPGLIRTSTGITGVDAAQTLVGLDIRPATNSLYALGYNATAQNYQIYSLNALTGVATAVNAAPIALPLGTGKIGFDFNPTVDRIRVTSTNRSNYRLNPIDGTIAATDLQLAYAATDANSAATPNIASVAYTNSVAGSTAATTTLYDYDQSLNILATQNPPNNGTLNTVGSSGLTVNTAAPLLDLDIYSPAAGTNTAYLTANPGTTTVSNLYTMNLTNGATTLVGPIGNGIAVRDITVAGAAGVATAVRRPDLASGLSVFPNPTTGAATVAFRLPRAGQVSLTVTDALGRTVQSLPAALLSAGSQQLRWDASQAGPGLYFVRLSVDGQTAGSLRLVIH